MKWIQQELCNRFECKSIILGYDSYDFKTADFLGRKITLTEFGIRYTGDAKHSQILLKEWQMENCKGVGTPGSKDNQAGCTEDLTKLLGSMEATKYRRAAARVNYMSLDRVDVSYASKETARGMANPTVGDVVNLKRVIRYLSTVPVFSIYYNFQDPPTEITGYSDSDWAGCTRTRKSTSGGAIMLGKHLVHHYSSTQATIALSSGEAELNAATKCTSECIGIKSLLKDLSLEKSINIVQIKIDSSAAKGVMQRSGAGKVKHLEVRQLWSQDLVQKKIIKVVKVPREENPADCLTHFWTAKEALLHFPKLSVGV